MIGAPTNFIHLTHIGSGEMGDGLQPVRWHSLSLHLKPDLSGLLDCNSGQKVKVNLCSFPANRDGQASVQHEDRGALCVYGCQEVSCGTASFLLLFWLFCLTSGMWKSASILAVSEVVLDQPRNPAPVSFGVNARIHQTNDWVFPPGAYLKGVFVSKIHFFILPFWSPLLLKMTKPLKKTYQPFFGIN